MSDDSHDFESVNISIDVLTSDVENINEKIKIINQSFDGLLMMVKQIEFKLRNKED